MIFQIPDLGKIGQFGNWLSYYCLAKKYAEVHGADLQTPMWQGQEVFDLHDPPIEGDGDVLKLDFPKRKTPEPFTVQNIWEIIGKERVDFTDNDARRYLPFREKPEDGYMSFMVVLHIRKHFWKNPTCHPVVSEKKLRSAIDAVGIRSDLVRIFSDETTVFSCSPVEDFKYMAVAQNLFCYPRSSFSLWAGIFNPNNVWIPHGWTYGETDCYYERK